MSCRPKQPLRKTVLCVLLLPIHLFLVGLPSRVFGRSNCARSKRDAKATLSQAALQELCSSDVGGQRGLAAQLLAGPRSYSCWRKHAVVYATATYAHYITPPRRI